MNWRGHIIASFAAYVPLVIFFGLPAPTNITAFIVLAFASILPDFDHPKSVIREVISILLAFFSLAAFLVVSDMSIALRVVSGSVAATVAYFLLKKIPLKHRGPESLHQWSICLLLTGTCTILFILVGRGLHFLPFIFVGYSIHLLIDKNV